MLILLKRLIDVLPEKRVWELIVLSFLMFLSGILEAFSFSAIVPFLGIIFDTERTLQYTFIPFRERLFGWNENELKLLFTVTFIVLAAVSAFVRFYLVKYAAFVNYGIGKDLGYRILKNPLYLPYSKFITGNSSDILGANSKLDQVIYGLYGLIHLIGSSIILICILIGLISFSPTITAIGFASVGSLYLVINLLSKKSLLRYSKAMSHSGVTRIQIQQEALGSIRDIQLEQTHSFFLDLYSKEDGVFRDSQAGVNVMSLGPRFLIEGLGMGILAFFAYRASTSGQSMVEFIPVFGMLALAAQRTLPLIQMINQGYTNFLGIGKSLEDILNLIEKKDSDKHRSDVSTKLIFRNKILLKDVTFGYPGSKEMTLDCISLEINRAEKIGIIGKTGSGKTTLADVLMGLLQPDSGGLFVDGIQIDRNNIISWQKNLGHVPQSVYLRDSSILENIAFATPKENIDTSAVEKAAKQASISGFIDQLPQGYDTRVGERGVLLSGGQRQRIGIARALYKGAKVLILDEATSALDSETENELSDSINALDLDITVIMIAHRISTLKNCNYIFEIEKGKLLRKVTYKNLIKESKGAKLR